MSGASELNQKPKVALVGPVLPYRGGIAQYTTQLHEAFGGKGEGVYTVSFKRQYPQWLYPGQGDKDEKAESIVDIHYAIDVYNPLTWRKAADDIAQNGCKVAVLDWWTLFWQPGFTYIVRRLRRKGVKTVYLCHNLKNHKTGGIMGLVDKLMVRASEWMLKQADGYIVQSTDHLEFMQKLKPGAEVTLKTHPIYDRFPPAANPLPQRGKLELLFFGFIRPYKGLPVLMKAVKQLNDKEIFLTVVGEPWGDEAALRTELEQAGVPNLDLKLEYVDDSEAANYFSRADVVVLPYLSATGSGVVAAAYHYGKPVIASAVGGLKDVVVEGKTGWLVEPNQPEALAEQIAAVSREACAQMTPDIQKFCAENSWDKLADTITKMAE